MKRRIFSILTALALCLSLLPTAAWAEEPDVVSDEESTVAVWIVTAFDGLAADVASQTLPQLAEGGEDEGPNLPDTLTASAYQGEDDTRIVTIEGVTWEAEPAFDPATPGDYVYTPALPEGYALAEGVALPTVTVTVEDAPPQNEPDDPPTEGEPVVYAVDEDDTAVNWADAADTTWYTGESDTYTISTAAELAGLASLVNSGNTFSGVTITLNNSIDLNSQSWTPIGTSSNSFQGTFDGDGKTISNLTVSTTSDYAGLFGYVDTNGAVQNVNVVDGNVTGGDFTGGVVGINYGAVTNCSFSGAVSGTMYTGGIVGNNLNGKVTSCHNAGTVTSTGGSNAYVGGVVGQNTGEVTACYNTGTLRAEENSQFFRGGVVGFNANTVQNCYNIGTVTDPYISGKTGGVIGQKSTYTAAVATNCYFLEWQEMSDPSLKGIGEDGSESGSNAGAEPKTAAAFAGGEVAWLLSGGDTQDPNSPWRQNLGSADADSSPVLDSTHARVYYDVDGGIYTNEDQSGKWDGTATDTSWYDETQTEFTITTAAQLAGFAKLVNSGTTFSGKTVYLGAEIDLRSQTWTPIGNGSNSFRGTFDGQGHTVKGLYVSISKTDDYAFAGLFGYVGSGGTVQNLAVSGTVAATIYDSSPNDPTVSNAFAGGVVGYNAGTVDGCSFSGSVSTGRGTGDNQIAFVATCAGGVVGYNTGTVTGSANAGTVTASVRVNGSAYAGGAVGYTDGGTVKDSTNTGNVTATGTRAAYAGGAVGYNYGGTVTNSTNAGTVTATSTSAAYAGGAVGCSEGTVTGFTNTGDVAATGTSNAYAGGVAGNGTVTGSTNTGAVTATSTNSTAYAGGVAGTGTVTGSTNTGDVAATGTSAAYAGGVAGTGTAIGSTNTGDVAATGTSAAYAGGAVGSGTVASSANTGAVTATSTNGTACAGGVAGYVKAFHSMTGEPNSILRDINSIAVENCYNTGSVAGAGGTNTYVGGVAGYVETNIEIQTGSPKQWEEDAKPEEKESFSITSIAAENCYNTGSVTGTGETNTDTGGVVGYVAVKVTIQDDDHSMSGSEDEQQKTTISITNIAVENCYNTGTISNGSNTGGVVGRYEFTYSGPEPELDEPDDPDDPDMPEPPRPGESIYSFKVETVAAKNSYFLETDDLQDIGDSKFDITIEPSIPDSNAPSTISSIDVESKTDDQFASGEVAYLLQADQETQYWGQTLGTDEVTYPVLTGDEDLSVVKVTFMVKAETGDEYKEHAAKYTNKGGTVEMPTDPTDPTAPDTHAFCGWYTSSTALTAANRFTANTTVAADTTVYAGMQLQYGAAEGGETVNTTYGVEKTADLSECIAYADDETAAAGNFSYTITSGYDGNYFSISGDTLTVSNTTPAGEYTLTITATENTPQITLLRAVSYGTRDVTFTVTVVVAKADPEVTAPTANTLTYTGNAQALVTAGSTTGGTIQYSTQENGTYSETIPTDTNAGTYTVYYKVEGNNNYNGVDAASVEVTIAKATPTYVVPTGLTAVRGQTLAGVKLPSGWAWDNGTQSVGGESTTYKATYTPSDTNNYNTVAADIKVAIAEKVDVEPGETVKIGDTTVINNGDGTVTVTGEDGTEITVTLPGESDSVAVDSEGNVTVPDGSTVKVGDTTITVGEDVKDATVDEDGTITLPSGGTVTVETENGEVTITVPEGGDTISVGDDGILTLPGGSTVTVGDKKTTIPAAGGKLDVSTGAVTINSTNSGSSSYTITAPKTENGTVTVSPKSASKGTTVTITVKPDSGYELDELTVTDKNGSTVKLTKKSDTQYTFTMPAGKVTVEASFVKETVAPSVSFTDVQAGAWYYDAALYAAENGLMSGTGNGAFSPDLTTSRAMIWTILARVDGQNISVTYGNWYDKAQAWAISAGVSDGTNPDSAITREQLAVMLYGFAKEQGYTTTGGVSLSRYVDASDVSSWAVEALEWAVGNGLISSMGNNILAPTGTATRAQVAVILMNFCENIAK